MSSIEGDQSIAIHIDDAAPPKELLVEHPDGTVSLGLRYDIACQDAFSTTRAARGGYARASADMFVNPLSVHAEVERLSQLRDLLAALDHIALARADERFKENFVIPIRRGKRRTAFLILLDVLYFVGQHLAVGFLNSPNRDYGKTFGDENFIISLLLAVIVAAIGLLAVARDRPNILTLFILAETASVVILLRSNFFIWLFILFRTTTLISACHLRFLWLKANRAAIALQAFKASHAAQRDSVSRNMDTTIALAHSLLEAVNSGDAELERRRRASLMESLETLRRALAADPMFVRTSALTAAGRSTRNLFQEAPNPAPRNTRLFVREIRISSPRSQDG